MQKKKIIKLEIKKEDILNLSNDEAQKVIGGGLDTNLECTTGYSRTCENETYPCDSTIADTELCNLSSEGFCESGRCNEGYTRTPSDECIRT